MATYSMRDSGGSYDWLVEGMSPQDIRMMSARDIYDMIDTHIEFAKEREYERLVEYADNLKYPVYGDSLSQVFNSRDEYIVYKREEMRDAFFEERSRMYDYITDLKAEYAKEFLPITNEDEFFLS
jgi:hypothetical protein